MNSERRRPRAQATSVTTKTRRQARARLELRGLLALSASGCWFALGALGCETETRATTDTDTTQSSDAASARLEATNAHDAGGAEPSSVQAIYASGECPAQLLTAGLPVKPTTYCSGRDVRQCREEAGCRSSADCTERPFGRCTGFERASSERPFIEFARCRYDGCHSDADCEAGQACACGLGTLVCVDAACRSDSDCAQGSSCVRADVCGWGPIGDFACTSSRDECRTNEDCVGLGRGNSCARDRAGHLACTEIICD